MARHQNQTEELETPIKVIHFYIVMEYLPVIIFTSSVCVVGILGNIFTIVFYKPKLTRSSTPYLIVVLAIVDMIVCVLGIASVLDLCINVLFNDRIFCKAMYFFDQWMIYISVLILWIISIDRYIKLCRPLGFQFTIPTAKRAIIIIVVFSLLASLRDVVTYDVIEVRIENILNNSVSVVGHYCTSSTNKNLKELIFYSHIFDMVVVTVVLITFAFTYSRIGYKLLKHERYMKTSSVKPFNLEQEDSSSNNDVQAYSNKSSVFKENVMVAERTRKNGTVFEPHINPNYCDNRISVQSTPSVNIYQKSVSQMKQSERNITSMMFAVSIGLAVCFMPYFIISVTARVHSPGKIEIEPLVQLAIRSPFLNSVINPILFSVFNPKYRKYVRRLFCRC